MTSEKAEIDALCPKPIRGGWCVREPGHRGRCLANYDAHDHPTDCGGECS